MDKREMNTILVAAQVLGSLDPASQLRYAALTKFDMGIASPSLEMLQSISTISGVVCGTAAAIGDIEQIDPGVMAEMFYLVFLLGWNAGVEHCHPKFDESLLDDVDL